MPTVAVPRRALALATALLALYPVISLSSAGKREPWEELDKRVTAASTFATLGPDAFGDNVNLSNGALSFNATDVSVPGNNALPVALGRSFSVENRAEQSNNLSFAEWDLEVPKISGTFAPDWLQSGSGTPGNRCSIVSPGAAAAPMPYTAGQATPSDVWNGITLSIPGVASDELLLIDAATPRPSSGGPYFWTVGNGQTVVSCLATIKNGTGEGFIVHTPDGSKYWFDWQAQYPVPDMVVGDFNITRRTNVLYATRVEDRFGNWVTYTYTNAWNAPARLQSINSSDSRSISVTYGADGHISTVSSGTQTWTYQYAARNNAMRPNEKTLRTVILPDNSRWTLAFEGLSNAYIQYPVNTAAEPSGRNCYNHPPNTTTPGTNQGTLTHPAGGQARFTIAYQRQSRSNVPISCNNIEAPTNNTFNDVNNWTISHDSFALREKQVSGPGLASWTWTYTYTADRSYLFYPGSSTSNPVCTVSYCGEPICTSDACAGTATTTVTGPNSEWKRLTYGNSFRYNEGKLLKIESGSSSTSILDTQFFSYDLSQAADQSYPKKFGTSPRWVGQGFVSEYHRPQNSAATSRQGEAFSLTNEAFDPRARPTQVWRRSTILDPQGQPYSKRDLITFRDDTARWILGQTASVQDQETGLYPMQMSFTTTSLPLTLSEFGRTVQTYGFNADGTLSTITDGRSFTTTFSDWYRGVPRSVQFPDSTSKSATVNERGWITSVTDQNGFVTNYGHDTMGRTSTITPPSGDTVAWTGTSVSYTQATATAMGLPVGHWKRSETRGNYRKETWFDGLWRPVVEREWDNANATVTQRFKGWRHDHAGRATFEGYPRASATGLASFTTGVTSTFDSLGRPTTVARNSELGSLSTSYAYLTGFRTEVTDPRTAKTTTAYQAFDAPDTSNPASIIGPEGVTTTIARDDFGKPKSLTRAGGGNSVTRTYAYDPQQRLCKQIDPETLATIFNYDANNNITWSTTGLGLTGSATSCDREWVGSTDKTTRTYDAMNRVTLVDFPDASVDISTAYTADGLVDTLSAGAHVWKYAYNRLRLPTNERLEHTYQGYVYPYPTSWTYTALGHRASMMAGNGLSVPYAPNALGQPTTAGTFATNATYFPDGTLKGFTYGNGTVRTVTQNTRLLPNRIADIRSGVTLLDDRYTYDANGNLTNQDDQLNLAGGDRTLTYDYRDRLLTAQISGTQTETFTYDALDNLRTRQFGTQTSTYNYGPQWRLDSIAGLSAQSFAYDVRGNMTSRAGRTHTFDRANRLTSVSGAGGATHEYDGYGRRTVSWRNDGTAKVDVYSADGVLRFTSEGRRSGAILYLHLGNQLVAERFANWDGTNPVVEYVHGDLVGSAVARTNSSGAIMERERSLSFGQALDGSKREAPGFTGHMEDPAIGLVYMQQRYYDPAIGRFLSVDPVGPLSNPINHFGRYHYAN
ncbi:RHS repeat domain-containing protein, partial [Silanimonas sp.]|uniref:RHS repeat domain-containing protein n=1 Tax=Silanimonas sp. TaxID=1929290 RepID=UPI0037CA1A01